jgi:class 3 adenylate cyclase
MAMDPVERRPAAILLADVVGYSRLMGEDEAGTHFRLKALRKGSIEPKIAEHRGRIVNFTGDRALVEFASVVDAVRCAVEVQRSIAKHNAGLQPKRRIEFRVGINFSDVIIDDSDICGDGVNLAARLEGLAPPGGVCISDVVHQRVGRLDLAFEDLGEQKLKNIAPVHAWRWTGNARATGPATVPPSPDKPSIAVLRFDNPKAYYLYLKGHEVLRYKSWRSIYRAREFFDQCIERAPDCAEAVGRLAHTDFCRWNFVWTNDSSALKGAIQLGEEAVKLNEFSPAAHEDLALVYGYAGQWDLAIAQAKRAIEIDPHYAKGHARLAEVLTLAGSPEQAPPLVEKARDLDPHYWDHFYHWVLGSAFFTMDRNCDAISSLRRSIESDPKFFPAHVHLAAIYAEVGQPKRAHRAVAEVLKISPDLSLRTFESRRPFGYKDENVWRRLVNGLRRAGLAK